MRLFPIHDQGQDGITVGIEIRNGGPSAFAWDSEFSVFMRWSVITDTGEVLSERRVRLLEQGPADDAESRFLTVAPGESLSKHVSLTGGFRHFVYGSGLIIPDSGEPYEIPIDLGEELVQIVIPEHVDSVVVRVQYEGVPISGERSFIAVFGAPAFKIGLLDDCLQSNELHLSKKGRVWEGEGEISGFAKGDDQ